MVRFAIRLQEQAGVDVVSDGEWRRVQYVDEFLDRIGGFERIDVMSTRARSNIARVIVRRLELRDPVFARDAKFLRANTDRCTKFALPSPFLICHPLLEAEHSATRLPHLRAFHEHLPKPSRARRWRSPRRALTSCSSMIPRSPTSATTSSCPRRQPRRAPAPGLGHRAPIPAGRRAINRIVEGLPAEVHLHCCHSVYKRRSDVNGDYKPILPRLQDARIDRRQPRVRLSADRRHQRPEAAAPNLGVGMGVVDVRTESPQPSKPLSPRRSRRAGNRSGAHRPEPGLRFRANSAEPPTLDEAYEKLKRLSKLPRASGVASPNRLSVKRESFPPSLAAF